MKACYCRRNGAVLLRSSQPAPGLFSWRNSEDEKLLLAFATAAAASREEVPPLLILDARSYTAAWANRAKGSSARLRFGLEEGWLLKAAASSRPSTTKSARSSSWASPTFTPFAIRLLNCGHSWAPRPNPTTPLPGSSLSKVHSDCHQQT